MSELQSGLTVFIIIWIGVLATVLVTMLGVYLYNVNRLVALRIKQQQANTNLIVHSVSRTKEYLDFLKKLSAEVAVMKFYEYIDSNHLEKTNKAAITSIVQKVSKSIKAGISEQNISVDDLLLTDEFIDEYLVNNVAMNIKGLLNDAVNSANN